MRSYVSCAALIESVDPEAALLELFERLRQVSHASDRQVFERTRGGFGDGFGQPRRAPLGNHYRVGPRRVRRTDNGSEVVRVLDAVQDHQKFRALGDLIERDVPVRRAQRYDALVRGAAGQPVQSLARLETHGHGKLVTEFDDFLDARPGKAFGYENAGKRATGAERLKNRMDTDAGRHLTMMLREGGVVGRDVLHGRFQPTTLWYAVESRLERGAPRNIRHASETV